MRRVLPVLLALSGLALMARPSSHFSGQEPESASKVDKALAIHYSKAYTFTFHRGSDGRYHRRTLPQMIQEQAQKHDGVAPQSITVASPPPPPLEPGGDAPRGPRQNILPTVVQSAALNADLIVLGAPGQGRSLPTSNHAFLFSKYPVTVSQVIYDQRTSVATGDTVVVSRGGGVLTVNGVRVTAIATGFPSFQIGRQYIFMLRFDPSTSTYFAIAPWTFEVKNGVVWSITPQMRRMMPPEQLSAFLEQLRAAVGLRRN